MMARSHIASESSSPIWYGTGDYEDPQEIREDREVECYYVWYESPGPPGPVGPFNSGSGAYATLAEAEAYVVKATHGTVRWLEKQREDL
jgi:hypothetical protein